MSEGPNYTRLYEIAEDQAGYFTAQQAGEASYSWERLSSGVKTGKFLRVSTGVYRLYHFPNSPFEDLFVAWLKTGPNSVVSHESALAVYGLTDALPGEVHVIVPRTASRRHTGLRLHTNRLSPDEITARNGLPVTTVARTIADVISTGLADELVRQAVLESLRRGLLTRSELIAQAERRKGKVARVIRKSLQQQEEEVEQQ